MTQWQSKYTDTQRAAIEHAWCVLNIKPRAAIARMAKAGELSLPGGERIPAFEIPENTVRDIGPRAQRRKAGKQLRPDYARMPARDRAHDMQLRLTAIVDEELSRLETRQAKQRQTPLNPQQLRDIGRVLKELATLPDPHEKNLPPARGQRATDGTKEPVTRGGIGAGVLAATDASISPSVRADLTPSPAPSTTTTSTTTPADQPDHNNTPHDKDHDDESGSCEGAKVPVLVA